MPLEACPHLSGCLGGGNRLRSGLEPTRRGVRRKGRSQIGRFLSVGLNRVSEWIEQLDRAKGTDGK